MRPSVALQVKRVVEALSAEGAEIPLDVAVALQVPVQQTLQSEQFAADAALELGGVGLRPQRRHLLSPNEFGRVGGHGVLDAESAVDQLHGGVRRDAKLESARNLY